MVLHLLCILILANFAFQLSSVICGVLRTYFKRKIKQKIPFVIGQLINALSYVHPRKSAKIALDLFCRPWAGKILDHQRNFLDKSYQKRIPFQDIEIQTYFWQGKGPTVLLIHGWESNTWRWRKVINRLIVENYTIIAFDGPAHGASGGRRFNAYVYAQMIAHICELYQPAHIVSHSIGAFASIYYVSKMDCIALESMVIMGSPNKLTDLTEVFTRILGFNNRVMKVYDSEFTRYFEKPQHYYNAEDFVKEVTVPALIVHDENDELNKFEGGLAIAHNWKGSTLFTTKGLGHSLQNEIVYDAIVAFLKKSR
jgi:pimeloyl-ACP methyl ester carboxylesterase